MPETTHGRLAEAPASSVAESVFLSPRLIDKAAFDQFASQLRGLVETAATQADALRSASVEAQRLHSGLREQSGKHAESLEAAKSLARSLSERVSGVEAVLARAQGLGQLADAFEQRAQQIADAKASALEQRFGQIVDQFGARAQERVQAAAAQATSAIELSRAERDAAKKQIETAVLPAAELLRAHVERAQRLLEGGPTGDTSPLTLCERLERASARAQQATEALEAQRGKAEEAVARLAHSLEGAVGFSDRLIQQNELASADIASAIQACEAARAQVMERARDAQALAQPLIDLEQRAIDAAQRGERAAAQIDTARGGGQEVVDELSRTVTRMQDVLDALEPWRAILLEGTIDGALPAPIADLIDAVRAGIAQDLTKMAAAMNLIAARAATSVGPAVPAGPGTPGGRGPEIVVRAAEPPLRLSEP